MGEDRARYTYRLRVASTARRALLDEWDRSRWVWNQCVAESRAAYKAQRDCGPARLDKMLTGWRGAHEWLREGGSMPQQQVVRDFAKSRAKALKDIKDRRPGRQRAGMPGLKKKELAAPTLNYTRPAADAAISATKNELINMARKHGRDLRLVAPAHTTMDCGRCGARAKHPLPLSERTYACTACGAVVPQDKNSARVMLARAGLTPAGADRGRPDAPPGRQAA